MKLRELKGIGEKTEKLFAKLGIETTEDLISFYPREYDEYTEPVPVSQVTQGQTCAVRAQLISDISLGGSSMNVAAAVLRDAAGSRIRAVWFHSAYLRSVLKKGGIYVFRGRVVQKQNSLTLEHPEYFTIAAYHELMQRLQPRYALTAGLSNKTVTRMVRAVLDSADAEEFLPEDMMQQLKLTPRKEALKGIHFPETREALKTARKRLAFDEFFLFLLAVFQLKIRAGEVKNCFPMKPVWDTGKLIDALPYRLTDAQIRSWGELEQDLSGETVMSRLLQGDVGSGKTILAFLAIIQTVENGYQSALMVPTEVLARQHFEAFASLCETYGLEDCRAALLTGQTRAKERRAIQSGLDDGTIQVVIGTHALLQDSIRMDKMALAVIDEQHRFGVEQRQKLAGKEFPPHVLAMSATPIPRSLAIILYGDLEISVIDEMPKNRLPIRNCVIGSGDRDKAFRFLERQVKLGRQAYVVCPMIEKSEGIEAENVLDYAKKLQDTLDPEIRTGILHGRMKASVKEKIMESFARGELDILVSTTVIEVGINVPNASVMVIENAERFGLAQLHQLRGRVGRGEFQSYCIFIQGNESEEASERLNVVGKSNDGFFIAGEDLRLRGPGDLLGCRQSGELEFRAGDIYRDADVLQAASREARRVLQEDPDLLFAKHQLIKKIMNEQMEKQWTVP